MSCIERVKKEKETNLSHVEEPRRLFVQDLVCSQCILLVFEARVHQVLELVEPDVILHVQRPVLSHDILHHSLRWQRVVLSELQDNERASIHLQSIQAFSTAGAKTVLQRRGLIHGLYLIYDWCVLIHDVTAGSESLIKLRPH